MGLFETELIQIVREYPNLKVVDDGTSAYLSGKIEILDEDNSFLDAYDIEIHSCDDFPYKFPIVYEVGFKIPKNIDWHVYEPRGNCCIKVMPEETLICLEGITLKVFIEEQLKPYLFNQTFRRENGYFIKERPHGVKAVIQYFNELLDLKDLPKLINVLVYIIFKDEPNRVAECFCGSNLKYRRCHREAYRLIKRIEQKELKSYLHSIMEYSN